MPALLALSLICRDEENRKPALKTHACDPHWLLMVSCQEVVWLMSQNCNIFKKRLKNRTKKSLIVFIVGCILLYEAELFPLLCSSTPLIS